MPVARKLSGIAGPTRQRSGPCIEQHLLAAADDVETVTQEWDGPFEHLRRYRFQCQDVKTVLYIHSELTITDDAVTVLGCGTLPL